MDIISKIPNPILLKIKEITNGKYLDLVGLAIVLLGSFYLEYHKTVVPITFQKTIYIFPLGIFSILNVGFSMIGTRLVTKKNNLGNFIHTFNTFLSGAIDHLLGNLAAFLTYPVSVIGNYLSYKIWKKKMILNSIDAIFYRNLLLGMILSLLLNYIGFYYFSSGAIKWGLFFAIAIPAGITFGGTFNTPRMYPDNWIMWQIYNLSKIIQCIMLLNIANIFKYVFYFINAILGYITWKDDKAKQL
ncbi:nicotinamide mononucleotide transporter [Flavobacterium sp. HNIBRBA15423]|uniref:nicotinamide mononucleotide transporter n=1 Tax=Flavobacterium sp. HNIBRBA15423 TaxID=3458683 RepID=UPI0040448A7D